MEHALHFVGNESVAHEVHTKEYHKESFWTKYIFSTDHKTIGIQYTIAGLLMAAVGGFLAYVFRYNLAYPNEPIPLFGNLSPQQYNAFVTNHGMIMVMWVA